MINYNGSCYCKEIKFELTGEPLFTQYCHCQKCREIASLSKRTVDKIGYNFTAAYLTARLRFFSGENHLETMIKNTSCLHLCKHCNSLIYGISQDPSKQAGIGVNINNVYFFSKTLPSTFEADKHIWYQHRLNDIDDGLIKYKDAPVEQFGTGEVVL